jgi:hypothetical protein
LHKGHDKVKSDPDNYRKITLLPVLCKLFETVLLNRSDKFIISDNKVGKLQGAAQEGASCLHTSLLLKETIQNKVDEDGSVHVIFLDARKAFDCAWSDALFVRLYELGVNGKLWQILKEWYRDLQCFVRVGCVYSQTFRVRIGVFQGGKWSSRLFQVFYSELINMLCKTLIGCNIYNLRAVCPTYADDIAIVAPFRVTMQRLLQVVESFASQWRLQFNPKKCAYMTFCKDDKISGIPQPIQLGCQDIEHVRFTKHLGTGIGCEETVVQNMIKKGKTAFYAILSLGKRIGGTNPVVANKLYWSLVVPSMLYGVQTLCLSETALDSLEKEHRNFGKRIQCLPSTTSNAAAYRLLGWMSVRAYCDLTILNFFYKTLLMKSSCLFKRVVLNRFVDVTMSNNIKHGPTAYFMNICIKYNLLYIVQTLVETGQPMSLEQWKKHCKVVVKQREDYIFGIELCMSEKLTFMHNLQAGVHQWWQISKVYPESLKACQFMVKLLVGEEPLAYNLGRFIKPRSIQNQMCQVCRSGALETTKHFLFECEPLENSRQALFSLIRVICGRADVINARDCKCIVSAQVCAGNQYFKKIKMVAETTFNMYKHRSNVMMLLASD